MRIVYVAARFPKLSETFVSNEVIGQLERGHDVRVLSLGPPDPDAFVEDDLRARTWVTPRRPWPVTPLPSVRELRIPEARLRRRVRAATAARWASQTMLRGFAPDLVHAHFFGGPTLTAAYLSALTGAPYTFFAHAQDYQVGMPDALLRARTLHAGAGFVPSRAALAEFGRRGRLSEQELTRLHVVRAAVRCRAVRGEPGPQPFTVVSVARLVPMKGLDTALRSLPEVRDAVGPMRYHIVGSGPERDALEQLASSLGVRDLVTFHGGLDNASAQRVVAGSDVALLPARVATDGSSDGLPVFLGEAGTLGVPAVSTPVSGIPELIEHGRSGLLVAPDAPAAIAAALVLLARDPGLRARLGRELQRRVATEFNGDRQLDRMHAVWDALLGSPQQPRPVAS